MSHCQYDRLRWRKTRRLDLLEAAAWDSEGVGLGREGWVDSVRVLEARSGSEPSPPDSAHGGSVQDWAPDADSDHAGRGSVATKR